MAGGSGEPEHEVSPEEPFERLKPFKDRVADDIRGDQGVIVTVTPLCRPACATRPQAILIGRRASAVVVASA